MPLILSGSAGLSGNVGTTTKEMLPAGSVIQVVQVQKTDTFSTSSTAPVDVTGLIASITPSSASNKILVLADLVMAGNSSVAASGRLMRNATPIYVGDAASTRPRSIGWSYNGNDYALDRVTAICLDTPASISAQVYKFQLFASGSGSLVHINRSQADRDMTSYDPRTASSITLLEIKA